MAQSLSTGYNKDYESSGFMVRGQTSILSPGSGQKMGRLASAKLVIHVKYGIFIYLYL